MFGRTSQFILSAPNGFRTADLMQGQPTPALYRRRIKWRTVCRLQTTLGLNVVGSIGPNVISMLGSIRFHKVRISLMLVLVQG